MIELWLDAQLPAGLARWITQTFDGCRAHALRDLGLAQARDPRIYDEAAAAGAVVMSKDRDFLRLWREREPRARVVLVTCGNASNRKLREILAASLPAVLRDLEAGSTFAEVSE